MINLKSVVSVLAVLFFVYLFGMVQSSDAFEITESPSNSDTYIYGGWIDEYFYVETSSPHFSVS